MLIRGGVGFHRQSSVDCFIMLGLNVAIIGGLLLKIAAKLPLMVLLLLEHGLELALTSHLFGHRCLELRYLSYGSCIFLMPSTIFKTALIRRGIVSDSLVSLIRL